jgi:hypothetical protein
MAQLGRVGVQPLQNLRREEASQLYHPCLGRTKDMQQLTAIEITNWIALYVATFCCCIIALVLSVGVLIYDLSTDGTLRKPLPLTLLGRLMLAPRLWWRWQKLYLLSTPVTLMIIAYFALSLQWH